MQVFVETHTYDGGFKSDLISYGRRPDILPSADQVGLRSTEAQLAAGDFALELTFFRRSSHFVCWLGCYTRGVDLKYGDRGTYCGVGIWLIDAVVKHGVHLIGFIEAATRKLAETNRVTSDIHDKLAAFVGEFPDLGWCVPLDPMPLHASGATSKLTELDQSAYLTLPDNQKTSFDLAGIDILGQFLIQSGTNAFPRRVYFLTRRSNVFVRQTEQVSFKNALTYAEHMIHAAGATAAAPLNRREAAQTHKMRNIAV